MNEPRHLAPVTFYDGGDPGMPPGPHVMQMKVITPADRYAESQQAKDQPDVMLSCMKCDTLTDDPMEAPDGEIGPWCPACIDKHTPTTAAKVPTSSKSHSKARSAELPPD